MSSNPHHPTPPSPQRHLKILLSSWGKAGTVQSQVGHDFKCQHGASLY